MQDALNLRKINLVGSKMKVYQERIKRSNPGLNKQEAIEYNENPNKSLNLEEFKKLMQFNEKVTKKTQLSMAVSMDYYKQAHLL